MGELVSGKQLAAGRALVSITQERLAEAAGLHVNSVRYVERQPRTTTGHSCTLIERAMRELGVVFFRHPTPGVRLAAQGEFGVVAPRQLEQAESGGSLSVAHRSLSDVRP